MLPILGLSQSHPSWWTYASVEARTIVGADWKNLRASTFGAAFQAELGPDGLAFPRLGCIDDADQILISAPGLLAMVYGQCPPAIFDAQAGRLGFSPVTYKGVNAWIAKDSGALSVAQINKQLLLIGSQETIAAGIDRGQETEASKRKYSPLLARAAQFSHDTDLWIVADRLPDDLANRFVPLTMKARGFDGYLTAREGLMMNATLLTNSNEEALVTAKHLREQIRKLSGLGRGIQIQNEGDQVTLRLAATPEELRASLRDTAPEAVRVSPVVGTPGTPEPAPETPKSNQRQVIRIVGLDEGPIEIPLLDPTHK